MADEVEEAAAEQSIGDAGEINIGELGATPLPEGLPELNTGEGLPELPTGEGLPELSAGGGLPELNPGGDALAQLPEGLPELNPGDASTGQIPGEIAGLNAGELGTGTSVPQAPAAAPMPEANGANVIGIQKIQNIKVRVQAMLGGISLSVSELANLKQGELLSLDTHVGEGIDILANGQLVARGEIVVVEEAKPRFGITLTEIVEAPDMAS